MAELVRSIVRRHRPHGRRRAWLVLGSIVAALGTTAARAEAQAPPAAQAAPAASDSRSMSTSAASEAAAAGAPAPSAPAGVTDPAGAEAPDPALRKIVLERRNGVVLGVSAGFGLAGASGHPNSAKLLDNPAYFSSTPMLPGYAMSFFLLGAFTDYVSFGPMVNIATFENEQWKSTGYALGFRLETFPLLRLFPAMADTSLYSQFGFGSTEARAKGNYPTADGSRSFLGVGVHHEFRVGKMLGGHAAIGPYVEYDATFAQSAERHFLSFGARVAWYGGRVTEDKN